MTAILESSTNSSSKPKKKGGKLTVFLLVIVLLLVAAVSATGFLYYQTKQELIRLTQPAGQEELAKKEVQAVVQKLGKLTILPEEEPVVATIIDAPFLATQSAFYQKAENGDKLVVYPQAQKAYVYSPGRNIIVNAGPLVLDQNEQAPEGTQPAESDVQGAQTGQTEQTEPTEPVAESTTEPAPAQ